MTDRCELRIYIEGRTARASLDTPAMLDATFGPTEVDFADLRHDTVDVLQDWLSRWQSLSRVSPTPLAEKTFEVLGRQLYAVLFEGELEQALKDGLKAAVNYKMLLRIRLFIKDDEFQRLPWEFLYYDGGEHQESYYFGKKADLQLYRSLQLEQGRTELVPCPTPLEVLFVLAMEEASENDIWEDVDALRTTLEDLARTEHDEDDRPRLQFGFAVGWDDSELKTKLQGDPHVLHIVGHAKFDSVTTQSSIELPGPGGEPVWTRSEDFVRLLTSRPRDERPRLVFLHLRQRRGGNLSDTFERLAPDLIRAGIPLVVAMQYPLDDQAAETFIQQFYGALARGKEVHVAVGDARAAISLRHNSLLLLGTPVLYMQSDQARLVVAEENDPHAGGPGARLIGNPEPRPRSAAAPGQARGAARNHLQDRLETVAESADDSADREFLLNWIREMTWTGTTDALLNIVRAQMKADPLRNRRRGVYFDLLQELRHFDETVSS